LIDSELSLVVYDIAKQRIAYKEKLIQKSQWFDNANGKHSQGGKESITLFAGNSLMFDKAEFQAEMM
jgi:hypothetical protein